ncbi:hypothetical protein [Dipodfec virus UOA04_Rod_751]|nr:hypothetical protein [Dipodfec virus UOA04_Rod_751]
MPGSVSKKLKTNLIQQNVYVRDAGSKYDIECSNYNSGCKKYISYDEVVGDNGIEIKKTLQNDPITPEYVDSFIEGSDYRLDPQRAILNSVKGVNLGDVREVQSVSRETLQANIAHLNDVVAALQKQMSLGNEKENINSEVKDNG